MKSKQISLKEGVDMRIFYLDGSYLDCYTIEFTGSGDLVADGFHVISIGEIDRIESY